MAIDYFGLFPCKVRESISNDELLAKIKAHNQANAALQVMRNNPHPDRSQSESEWTITIEMLTPEGPKQKVVRIHDLLREAEPLGALSAHCIGCPENVRDGAFGCGGAIHYPISEQAERWLMSRLPVDMQSPQGVLLTRAITDFGYDGSVIDVGRRQKQFYQADKAVERRWGGFLRKKTRVNSSQILQMVFAVGSLQASHAKMVAYFMGFLNDALELVDAESNFPQPADDAGTIELKLFFRIAASAGTQAVPVFIDA
ncbi:TPA: hypothetical protein QDB15_006802 [Burkholderia vietnamiensis]|uniref:hypothetical protein n=1 Tax=Burkholderia vietnamiensis TaxID=60552 RepID=UPI0012D8901B|nr:hypothetical protein [Burkholderia vietnamiensis]MCA8209627.1 hypothetical protein [Burkholderia vietnamiensis]HDR9103160.1 hypothetical protein [Burkholderia vietnamiensis]HDR9122888.1 hypothetical protein [Burkholderia vietnamiensis]HDR9172672.1 hypothetical protein [Burkholderia vietnamiensis]HDR9284861.1 hypothetical protein [Burkholderia vietnamiensis]